MQNSNNITEISIKVFEAVREETKKANISNHLQHDKYYSKPDGFSLFDYLGIDEVN